jgi:hypothetical protein
MVDMTPVRGLLFRNSGKRERDIQAIRRLLAACAFERETPAQSGGSGPRGTLLSNPAGTANPSATDDSYIYIDNFVICDILSALHENFCCVCTRALFRPSNPQTYGRALQIARPLLNSDLRQIPSRTWRGAVARSSGPHRKVDCGLHRHSRLFLPCVSRAVAA